MVSGKNKQRKRAVLMRPYYRSLLISLRDFEAFTEHNLRFQEKVLHDTAFHPYAALTTFHKVRVLFLDKGKRRERSVLWLKRNGFVELTLMQAAGKAGRDNTDVEELDALIAELKAELTAAGKWPN